ncbi:MAG: D-alanine--D-alanine ligase, partial [Thermoanaerobaculia bacterium]|nr:D-alanine--D-alanine ligase [Thermoanaerobaculia bacterium]
MTRIALITGGSTPERNVALAGAGLVAGALRSRGHEVTVIDTFRGVLDAAAEDRQLDPAVALTLPGDEELEEIRRAEDLPGLVRSPLVKGSDLVFP